MIAVMIVTIAVVVIAAPAIMVMIPAVVEIERVEEIAGMFTGTHGFLVVHELGLSHYDSSPRFRAREAAKPS
jgi:hypothetical protein